jgi:hypothetical protein
MGWTERDYARWTKEERERFYGGGAAGSNVTAGCVFRRGIGPAVLASGVLFAVGHFPTGHPILPFLRFSAPASRSSVTLIRPTGTIDTPSTAPVGSTLTFRGSAPPGDGPVTVEGSYDGSQTWQVLSSVGSADGTYAAQITLGQRGLLQIKILFADGSQSVGSIAVE